MTGFGQRASLLISHFPFPTIEQLYTWRRKLANAWVLWPFGGLPGRLGNDILTFAIPPWRTYSVYICMKWTKEVSTSLSFCFPLLVIIHIKLEVEASCVELSWANIQHIWQQISTYLFLPANALSLSVFH